MPCFESFYWTSSFRTMPRVLFNSARASNIGRLSLIQRHKMSQVSSPFAIASHWNHWLHLGCIWNFECSRVHFVCCYADCHHGVEQAHTHLSVSKVLHMAPHEHTYRCTELIVRVLKCKEPWPSAMYSAQTNAKQSKQSKQATKASKQSKQSTAACGCPKGTLLNGKVIHAMHWKYVFCTYYFVHRVLLHWLSRMYPHQGHLDHTQQFTFACMQASVVMVTKEKQAKSVYNIAKKRGRVALDCDGCSLSRTGQLCLVQVISFYIWH